MNDKLLLGAKFYRFDENENIEVIRVYKSNGLEIKVYTDGDKSKTRKMLIEDLHEKGYVKLNPHAIVNFTIANLQGKLKDVIVAVHKMSDLMSNEPTPYCVCRQNITDLFANQIQINKTKTYAGCCMSLETCPPDVDYRLMIACNGIDKCINVCAYMDDTLEDLLFMINSKSFDDALAGLFIDHVNYDTKDNPVKKSMKPRIMKLDSYDGYCKKLKTLLEHNNFMYDFYRSFGIIPINKEVIYDDETRVVSVEILDFLEKLNGVNIIATLCMEYWYDIDLSEIKNDYNLVIDKNDKLFVIAYEASGPLRLDIENIESEENIEKMANSTIGSDKSIKETAEIIRINKNKYN